MKLLLDENLSRRIVPFLQADFPGSSQVTLLDLGSASDLEIWEYAKANGYVIVSRDADFQERSLVTGHPPQVVWLKISNRSKTAVLTIFCLSIARKLSKHFCTKTSLAWQSASASINTIRTMALTRNEIRKRLSAFAKEQQGAYNEKSQAQTFWLRFYECFGIRAESATIYEQSVKKLGGAQGFIDSFIPGTAAYGKKSFATEAERVAFLFERYQHLTSLLPVAPVKKARKRKE